MSITWSIVSVSSLCRTFGGTASNSTFIKALYVQLLNRTPSQAEINGWLPVLATVGRTGVANAFLTSVEYRFDTIKTYYSTILRRGPAPTGKEVMGWVNTGADLLSIQIAMEASVEFYFRVTGSFPNS